MPITTQLNTGYSVALVHRQMKRPPLIPLTSVRRSEPALHGPVPAGTAGLLLFRFEGAARLCRVGPGDVPPARCSFVRAWWPRSVARVELRSSRPRCSCSPRSVRAVAPAWTAHPVRAPVGRFVPSFTSPVSAWKESRPRRALCSPLRIPKRARASLFSKLQRANGECLGV